MLQYSATCQHLYPWLADQYLLPVAGTAFPIDAGPSNYQGRQLAPTSPYLPLQISSPYISDHTRYQLLFTIVLRYQFHELSSHMIANVQSFQEERRTKGLSVL